MGCKRDPKKHDFLVKRAVKYDFDELLNIIKPARLLMVLYVPISV